MQRGTVLPVFHQKGDKEVHELDDTLDVLHLEVVASGLVGWGKLLDP